VDTKWEGSVPGWAEEIFEVSKTVMPWLTGGLAGAALTYLLNQRSARNKRARLLLTTERVDYSLAARDEGFTDLRVSYEGREFDNLLLFQITAENISGKTIHKCPLLLLFAKPTEIVDQSSFTHPLKREVALVPQLGHELAYLWDPGELQPSDSARLRLLLAPTTAIKASWRGDDDIDVIRELRDFNDGDRQLAWVLGIVTVGLLMFLALIVGVSIYTQDLQYFRSVGQPVVGCLGAVLGYLVGRRASRK
jgi:hypothetical protein